MAKILIDITEKSADAQAREVAEETRQYSGCFVNVQIKDYHGKKYDPETVKWLIVG